ncbi:MAG: protein-export chaperone SecB [bacterium]|nr:protein-export chaperone SecB [bacterium]
MSTPPFVINAQYVKDLSFENPDPTKNLLQNDKSPDISVSIDVQAQGIAENTYEVTVSIQADAKREKDRLFLIELSYAGVFTVEDKKFQSEEKLRPLLLIDCPHLLFPFARAVIANTTREGGFPPLALAPVDFTALYEQQGQSKKKAASK